jgi:thiamine-phosphate pyrophosphorylase
MIILFSPPENRPDETALLNRMLKAHPSLILHLRKPALERLDYEQTLGGIEARFHPQIVLHQHHSLADYYDVKGVHFTESVRGEHTLHGKVVSTSFHSQADAQNYGMIYEYFFCSPVFPSISKQGYAPSENWDLSGNSEAFREKAVALGGIDQSRLAEVRKRGFHHFAVLGAVWESPEPENVLHELMANLE